MNVWFREIVIVQYVLVCSLVPYPTKPYPRLANVSTRLQVCNADPVNTVYTNPC